MKKEVGLKDVKYKHFKGAVGKHFEIQVGKKQAKAELVEVSRHGAATMPDARKPFSLVFKLDPGVAMESGVYSIKLDRFGSLELLMTPLVPDSDASYFEAVFG